MMQVLIFEVKLPVPSHFKLKRSSWNWNVPVASETFHFRVKRLTSNWNVPVATETFQLQLKRSSCKWDVSLQSETESFGVSRVNNNKGSAKIVYIIHESTKRRLGGRGSKWKIWNVLFLKYTHSELSASF